METKNSLKSIISTQYGHFTAETFGLNRTRQSIYQGVEQTQNITKFLSKQLSPAKKKRLISPDFHVLLLHNGFMLDGFQRMELIMQDIYWVATTQIIRHQLGHPRGDMLPFYSKLYLFTLKYLAAIYWDQKIPVLRCHGPEFKKILGSRSDHNAQA